MTTWSELLGSQLSLPFLRSTEDAVPFGLTPVDGAAWRVDDLAAHDGDWRLTAHTEQGLEGAYSMRFFPDTRAVEVWGEVTHRGTEPVAGITRSLTLDAELHLAPEFERAWVRSIGGAGFTTYFPPRDFSVVDRQLTAIPSLGATVALASAPNGRTSAEHLPCAILGDEHGTAGLAFFLEWSGLWSITISRPASRYAPGSGLRLQIGIWGLDLELRPGQRLPLPRLLIAAYDGDLEAGGNALRRHIRRHVMPPLGGEEVLPPASFNHWFAFVNDFSAESLRPEVAACAAAGLEYFCVDGGWFRDSFPTGIGNWNEADPGKFPDGIEPFADLVREAGMKYGTWFEPEWAHVESDLYREHPEWFWRTPASRGAGSPADPSAFFQSPEYALLNFGLPEVRAWWVERITRAYTEWGVRWIRWDFNHNPRPNWDSGVPVGEIGWRQIEHIEGLYATLDEILGACPELFIEQCASGGHRIDLGMVRRGHSFWMNDVSEHTDLVRALQHGLNTVLPGNYANTNLCQPRHDFSDYDYLSHATGGFGYSGALSQAPPEHFDRFAAAVARYKEYRPLLLGDYARPTGQPRRADDYAKVVFSDGSESLTIEYNHDGPGSARVERNSEPA